MSIVIVKPFKRTYDHS